MPPLISCLWISVCLCLCSVSISTTPRLPTHSHTHSTNICLFSHNLKCILVAFWVMRNIFIFLFKFCLVISKLHHSVHDYHGFIRLRENLVFHFADFLIGVHFNQLRYLYGLLKLQNFQPTIYTFISLI